MLENVCLGVSRLVDSFVHSPPQLEMLAAHSLLPSLLRLASGMIPSSSSLGDSRVGLSEATYTGHATALESLGPPQSLI